MVKVVGVQGWLGSPVSDFKGLAGTRNPPSNFFAQPFLRQITITMQIMGIIPCVFTFVSLVGVGKIHFGELDIGGSVFGGEQFRKKLFAASTLCCGRRRKRPFQHMDQAQR